MSIAESEYSNRATLASGGKKDHRTWFLDSMLGVLMVADILAIYLIGYRHVLSQKHGDLFIYLF
jgi:hypothetical protein